ncbi:MAG: LPXTG cell wall anchor domain-containing protein, partial [Leptotrichia sp.]|nr:LPXTG cell wall anchor domain-containing protein [Leptotrichia sp.]
GEVLGENRVAPVAEAGEEKKGVVLGESRPSVKGVSDRASVATGDYNFTGLWASLFGISLAALAGFVVLQKKKEN